MSAARQAAQSDPRRQMCYELKLRPLPGWRLPAELRLRAALKRLLRNHKLRYTSCRPCLAQNLLLTETRLRDCMEFHE
jgi:hypothetical protein